MDQAACHGRAALFFAADQFSETLACAICRHCPVQAACEAHVKASEAPGPRFGVVAGFRPADRRQWE
jgi:hypothetical protein